MNRYVSKVGRWAVLVLLSFGWGCGPSTPESTENSIVQQPSKTKKTIIKMNRLSTEKSPYLLQHKDNPVHWYPWSQKAFDDAKNEDKPIFLSIGYATCHWCHVMAHESFEDEEVAAILNKNFISIKVDREERPDVDHIYMSVAQILTGNGGWPLTILMTPDKEPFFAATYLPKESRFGRTGLTELLEIIDSKWRSQRDNLLATSAQITEALVKMNEAKDSGSPDKSLLDTAFEQLAGRYDPVYGGFSQGTKFPTPHNLIFLLRYFGRTGSQQALTMAENTLQNMRAGGIYDHIGYGFHRYSTDTKWLVPHFEKMLYDQAMLMLAFSEAYEVTEKSIYKTVVNEIAQYLKLRMRSPLGGFYSAEDADSQGVEGKYYVWKQSDINQILKEDAELFRLTFQIQPNGNFESHQTPPHTNIPHLKKSDLESYLMVQDSVPELEAVRQKLLSVRNTRIPPLLDDKILTDWNGLMIGALARAGRVLENSTLIEMAEKSAEFINKNMTRPSFTLLHRYRDGDAAIDGQLDDYAFLIFGLIELYQATSKLSYLEQAQQLQKKAMQLFMSSNGSFYLAAADAKDLIVRPREFYDGAIPSGNSMMLENLIRLSRILGDASMEKDAHRLAGTFVNAARRSPDSHTQFMIGLNFALGPSLEIVVVGEPNHAQTKELIKAATTHEYIPNRVLVHKTTANAESLAKLAPYTKDQVQIKKAPTAYVCVNHSCEFPTNSADKLREQITTLYR